MNTVLAWIQAHALHVAAITTSLALLLPLLTVWARRSRTADGRTPAAVIVASLAALACTAYSADTSLSFAEHALGMVDTTERAVLFLAGELALFACALMARQNLRGPQKAPGTPGLLVWFITAVQVIPAYHESGFVGGTVRAVLGPVMAALLWHLAMGIELRHRKPGDTSQSLPAVIGRELRERLLSRLGLATRDRSAEQITRDRATARAVQLASRSKLGRWGRARLAAAVARSGVGTDPVQRDVMMRMLAARRGALRLSTVDLVSPFEDAPQDAIEDAQDAEDAEDAEQSPAVHPRLPVVPHGVRLLPMTARPVPAEPTVEDADEAPEDDQDADEGPPPTPPLMTSAQVADHYGIKPSTVRNWVALGRIPVHSKDAVGRNLFHPDELPKFQVAVVPS
ncbi:helix-turn-helix domain-containing protein [Streptomyces sp. NPDC017941]|uniref:helix-turn-helix domain-containing protein n=1 Tax=Streptomyces sp. NPDC017941 TaxID=3365018 RepID=UPI003788770D